MDRNHNNLENLLPLLGAITNGNTMNNNQNFINQLVNAISSAVGAANSATTRMTDNTNNPGFSRVRHRSPEPPPAPSFQTNLPAGTRPNRGTAPMDIENESDFTTPNNVMSSKAMLENMGATLPNNNILMNRFQSERGNNGPPAGGMNAQQTDRFTDRQSSMNPEPPVSMNAPPPMGGRNAPPTLGGRNAPPPLGAMNAPPPLGGMNAPPPMRGINAPPPMGGRNALPPMGGTNAPPPMRGMNAPPQMGGMNGPPQMGGMNGPPPIGGMNGPPPMGGMNGPPPMGGMNGPPPMGGMSGPPQTGGMNGPPQMGGMNAPAHMGGAPPAAYMYFPAETAVAVNAASTSAAAAATQAAANQMFMDPTTMLAAMQQMQQNYAANFTLSNAEAGAFSGPDMAIVEAASKSIVAGMKEIIKTKSCILYPPSLTAAPPSTRERPPGCRTIFIGGLPENCTEEIIREIFESCGEITTLRASKKNFCHIRYRLEESVERAIYLSGYRMNILDADGKESSKSGRLHVDYAQARDDLYDYECKQRQLQREQRHRDKPEKDPTRSASPPPIPLYNDTEVATVSEHLRSNDTFIKAVQTMAAWLERGDCKKHNANTFYSMIQSTHAHVRRLHTDKQQMEDELRKARESYRKQMLVMSKQFTQIEKVFSAASHKKVWDHFSKAQRKNIEQWKKLALELRSVQMEDDEMEMSDDDRSHGGGSAKRARYDAESLKEENDTLRCQLEALRSEMSHDLTDTKHDGDYRDKQIKVLQEAIRNTQTQLIQMKVREEQDNKFMQHLQRKLKEANVKELLLKTKIKEATRRRRDRSTSSDRSDRSYRRSDDDDSDDDVELVKVSRQAATGNRARIVNQNQQGAMQANSSGPNKNNGQVIDIDDDVIIQDQHYDVVEIQDEEDVQGKTALENAAANKEKPNDEEKEEDKQKIDATNTIEQATGNVTETKLSDEKAVSELNLSDGKTCIAEVETKLVEEPNEIEPKFLPFIEAKIIALAAAYLIVQPFGIKTESICAYLQQTMDTLDLQATTLEQILGTYTNLFKLEGSVKNDLDTESKALWKFCGFSVTNVEPLSNGKADMDKKEY